MSQYVETPCKGFTAGAALAQFRRVKLSSGKVIYATATDVEIGTIENVAYADLDPATVRMRTAQGTCKMVASEAIGAGNPCYAAANGKIASSGTLVVGHVLEAATADNDIVEVLRVSSNTDVSASISGTSAGAFEVDNDGSVPRAAIGSQAGGTGDFTATVLPPATLTDDRDYTLPADSDQTLVGATATQTLTNKTLGAGTKAAVVAVAAAGSAQGDAAALTAGVLNLVSAADGTKGVKFPTAAAGDLCLIYSSVASQDLNVYPNTSDDINDGTTNAAVVVAPRTLAIFIAVDDTTWAAMFTNGA